MTIVNNIAVNSNRIQNSGTITARKTYASNTSFQEVFKGKLEEKGRVAFSKHAEDRLRMRNINLTENQLEKVNLAVARAQEKGLKDSLVLVDDIAFVVNVGNKTVITAVKSSELKGSVFTNIDGAVFG